ncbi:MAG TPA: hypothetical protein VFL67_18620 [Mycobacterium sp.]|nr:hypothetical protein [Mycobacterium sp.]
MAQQLWFGTKQNFQWVPMPSSGIQRRNVFSSESGTLDRGGAYVSRSTGSHVEYDFSFGTREASGVTGLNVYQEYATGMWDDYATVVNGYNPNDLIYFADPMAMRANQFSPHWATPMLALSGDYPHIGNYTSHTATSANVYRQPQRTVSYALTNAANAMPTETYRKFLIPIPPGHTLRIGWSGSVTGTGYLRAEAHVIATNSISAFSIAPVSATAASRGTSVFNGDTYDYVTFALARGSSAVSTASVTSMMAQTYINSYAATLTGPHVAGVGQTGCEMSGDLVETYVQADDFGQRRLKSLSFGLVEVGSWLP